MTNSNQPKEPKYQLTEDDLKIICIDYFEWRVSGRRPCFSNGNEADFDNLANYFKLTPYLYTEPEQEGSDKSIRDEMDSDMESGSMPQGEIESCLNHWQSKYVITRKSKTSSIQPEQESKPCECNILDCPECYPKAPSIPGERTASEVLKPYCEEWLKERTDFDHVTIIPYILQAMESFAAPLRQEIQRLNQQKYHINKMYEALIKEYKTSQQEWPSEPTETLFCEYLIDIGNPIEKVASSSVTCQDYPYSMIDGFVNWLKQWKQSRGEGINDLHP